MGHGPALDGVAGLVALARGLRPTVVEARRASRVERILGSDLPDPSGVDVRVLGHLHEASIESTGRGRESRRALGSWYTPRAVVQAIVRRTVAPALARRLAGSSAGEAASRVASFRVCDPAMGCGFFLLEALDVIAAAAPGVSRSDVAGTCLHGMDLDPGAARVAASCLWLEAADPGLTRRALMRHLLTGNALSSPFPGRGEGFDTVVGNPPYGALLDETTRRHITGRYATAGAGYRNTALHFIERAHDLLAAHGRAGLIVPKSLAYSRGWAPAVRIVLPGLEEVIDASLAFEGVRLEQVIVIFGRASSPRRTYASSTLEQGRVHVTGRLPRRSYEESGVLLCGVDRRMISLFRRLQEECRPLSEVSASFRGLGIQRHEHAEGEHEAIHGKAVGRYHLRRPLRRFRLADGLPPKAARLRTRPKIVSQNVVAHVRRPRPRIVLTSAMDTRGRLSLDTVTNTVITDPRVDPWFVLALLNSAFVSWYAHAFVFGGAVRTMHLDAGYIGRLPIPYSDASADQQARAAELARSASRRLSRGADTSLLDGILEGIESAVCTCYGVDPDLLHL